MNMIEAQKKEMYEYLEIYDAYNTLQDISKMLTGCGCDCGYGEGILGKLTYIVDLTVFPVNIFRMSIRSLVWARSKLGRFLI